MVSLRGVVGKITLPSGGKRAVLEVKLNKEQVDMFANMEALQNQDVAITGPVERPEDPQQSHFGDDDGEESEDE